MDSQESLKKRLGELETQGGPVTDEYATLVNNLSYSILEQLRASTTAQRAAARSSISRNNRRTRRTRKSKLRK